MSIDSSTVSPYSEVHGLLRSIAAYLEVLKPRESLLLAFLGAATAVVAAAGEGIPAARLVIVAVTVLVAAAGANGLTNYLDRDLDAKMERTRNRALPSGRISPPEKVLPLTMGLALAGLALSWAISAEQSLHMAFVADLAGTVAAVVWRKRATCVFPQGIIASCAPVLIGWFGITAALEWELALMCALVCFWVPLHVWSVMLANREDYVRAGITYFPLNRNNLQIFKLLLIFSLGLGATAVGIYFVGRFSLLYLGAAVSLSLAMILATLRLSRGDTRASAWRLYKLSAFPYLGLIFLAMSITALV